MTIAALDPLRVELMLPARLFGTMAAGDVASLYPNYAIPAGQRCRITFDPMISAAQPDAAQSNQQAAEVKSDGR